GLDGVLIKPELSEKCGICGTHMQVTVRGEEEQHHYHGEHHHNQDQKEHHHTHHHAALSDIYAIVDGIAVSEKVKEDVKAVYQLIAEAESKVHGREVINVHFHEVGMLDAVADITLTAMLMEELAPEQVIASPVNVGYGRVHCAHGILPVPAPAAMHLLSGIPCYAGSVEGELCTPTGAALLKYYVNKFENLPQMTMECVGYGMGKKDFPVANCLRAVLGQTENVNDEVIELRCNIDDMTPEELGHAIEILLKNKALDVYTVPIGMKKSRTGILLNVMCRKSQREEMIRLVFKHTTTIGLREYRCNRVILEREEYTKSSIYGDIRIKRVAGFGITREKPEYEDLKTAAEKNGISIREVKAALAKKEQHYGETSK
ncbi:MAG: nickel pincer cofactor biosynthesis protein LarC, partial [Lachnospiraceae bacterium]|nr:nickel pincer cofactor biosynthesis protein LarC [Lachnospiraceae bacterium]